MLGILRRLWRSRAVLSIYCDGSSHPFAGMPGGWGYAVVKNGQCLLEGSGGERSTTNNLMELQAALAGLRAVIDRGWHQGIEVELVSDSRHALEIAAGQYLPSKQIALAEAVRAACVEAGARTRWVKGHSGDRWNERADALARAEKQARVPARARRDRST